jgi:hypothetical protein
MGNDQKVKLVEETVEFAGLEDRVVEPVKEKT